MMYHETQSNEIAEPESGSMPDAATHETGAMLAGISDEDEIRALLAQVSAYAQSHHLAIGECVAWNTLKHRYNLTGPHTEWLKRYLFRMDGSSLADVGPIRPYHLPFGEDIIRVAGILLTRKSAFVAAEKGIFANVTPETITIAGVITPPETSIVATCFSHCGDTYLGDSRLRLCPNCHQLGDVQWSQFIPVK